MPVKEKLTLRFKSIACEFDASFKEGESHCNNGGCDNLVRGFTIDTPPHVDIRNHPSAYVGVSNRSRRYFALEHFTPRRYRGQRVHR